MIVKEEKCFSFTYFFYSKLFIQGAEAKAIVQRKKKLRIFEENGENVYNEISLSNKFIYY